MSSQSFMGLLALPLAAFNCFFDLWQGNMAEEDSEEKWVEFFLPSRGNFA